jgi:hypothetical protein
MVGHDAPAGLGLIFDPVPTPVVGVDPVPDRIGLPVARPIGWRPDIAPSRAVSPCAVRLERGAELGLHGDLGRRRCGGGDHDRHRCKNNCRHEPRADARASTAIRSLLIHVGSRPGFVSPCGKNDGPTLWVPDPRAGTRIEDGQFSAGATRSLAGTCSQVRSRRRQERSMMPASPSSLPNASSLPSGLQASAETGAVPGRFARISAPSSMRTSSTSPSA